MAGTEKLALLGGKPAVTASTREQWRPDVEAEKRLIGDLLDRRVVTGSGSGFPKEFEEACRARIGCRYFVTLDHGSSALAAACYAAGLGPGDEFIAPTAGYIGGYAGALHLGATPVFCEVDPHTLLMDPADAERRITPRTRVLMPIHWNGRPCDMDTLLALAEKHGLTVVEDAAHAFGSTWDGKVIGNVGHVACFSFQGDTPGGKPVAGGEGGALATNDREIYERHLAFCHLHRSGLSEELTREPYRHLDFEALGWKWRAHPLALALAQVSLKGLDDRARRLTEHRERFFAGLEDLPAIEPVRNYPKAAGAELYDGLRLVYHPDRLDGLPTARLAEALKAEGVPIKGVGFNYLEHLRYIYNGEYDLWGRGRGRLPKYVRGDFPVSEDLHTRVLRLPAWIEPAEGLIEQMIAAFHKVAANAQALR